LGVCQGAVFWKAGRYRKRTRYSHCLYYMNCTSGNQNYWWEQASHYRRNPPDKARESEHHYFVNPNEFIDLSNDSFYSQKER
jgi:hypothetical protein